MPFVRNASKDLNAFCLIKRLGRRFLILFSPGTTSPGGLLEHLFCSHRSIDAYPLACPALLE